MLAVFFTIEQDALLSLCALLSPSAYDDLFGVQEDGTDDDRPTRGEVIGAIIDHIDADNDMVVVDEQCQIQQSGAGAEERRYRDLEYGPKNEPFTTLDELLTVPGVTPQFLELFRSNLTVYAVADRFYVNLADAQGYMGFLCAHTTLSQASINVCQTPQFAAEIGFLSLALEGWVAFFSSPLGLLDFYLGFSSGQAEQRVEDGIAAGQMIAFRTEQDFITVLNLFVNNPETAAQYAMLADPTRAQLLGYVATGGTGQFQRFSVDFDQTEMRRKISVDIPRVFRISATGSFGIATRTITAVVDFTQDGRMLYYREY
ncbi:MAG: general secretion pathway protein GspK [Myxococcales bacterium]|nr:general secretion pathway protein GspK [Myxococcales bacterium]